MAGAFSTTSYARAVTIGSGAGGAAASGSADLVVTAAAADTGSCAGARCAGGAPGDIAAALGGAVVGDGTA